MAEELTPVNGEYTNFLRDLKVRIQTARVRAALAVNRELVLLYWHAGQDIVGRQEQLGWGDKILDRLADDIRASFPGVEGFSKRNLYRMRAFFMAYRHSPEFVPQLAAQMPWYHNVILVEKVKEPEERIWYAQKTVENGWSRAVLEAQIETRLFARQGSAVTNFDRTLPPLQSDLARQTLKDPYNFDFLTLAEDAHERDLERGLLDHIRQFLLELGAGFSFLGSQYHLEIGGQDYYIDLLFYHVRLRCYIVVDLKMTDFQPEFAGKMNFYLAVADDLLRHPDDAPSVGIILCKSRNRVVAEYALRDMTKPIGVAEYRLSASLPDNLKGSLPTIEELEAELSSLPAEDTVADP